jgi:hypothetical protein
MKTEYEKLLLDKQTKAEIATEAVMEDFPEEYAVDKACEAQHLKTLNGILNGEWLDKPDSEGWWWFAIQLSYSTKYKIDSCWHIVDFRGKYHAADSGMLDISEWNGKWQKAIVPNPPEKE